ncbi:Ig-like domain-containing protein [Candidatus Palauibacter sp.]|uniref:Ig-like domain-containing protein n=1 Tax=Candidatus Palauibacter sp. TaxID=3101350 RepID=UPI003AF26725
MAGYFSDADGDELSYDAGSSNEAAATVSMDGSSATVTGVADGTAVVTITARDPDGGAAAQSVSVTVGDGVAENRSPVAVGTIPAHDVDVGGAISIRLGAYFSDPDGDALTYAAESSNSDAATTSVEAATVTISGVADGKAVVTVTASDPDGESAEQTVSLTVGDGVAENRSPVAVGTIPAYDVDVGGAISIRLGAYFSDPDGDALTYGAESSNSDAASTSVEAATVTISGVADGKAVVTVTASDPDGESAEQTVSVTIGDGDSSNNPPVAQGSIPDHSVGVGGTVTVDVTGYFSDADGDELSYMASSSNADVATASMEGTTVTIEGVAAGQAVINVTASDGESTVAQGFSVTVEAAPANNPPVAQGSIPDHSVGVGGTVTVDVTGYFSDADGDELSYMASSSNADVATASMEGTTVTIEGVAAGQAVINVTASDGESTVAQGFSVTVEAAPVNNPPVAVSTIPGSSFEIGGTGTIDAAGYFSDADGDELTYTGSSSNEGVATVAMEGSTATITAIAAGDAVITISASDGSASVSQGFTVTVQAEPVNNPPVAVGTIPGSSLEIGGTSTIDAAGYFSDADADELTYTGSSSNEGVATVAMEGASATITAIAAGDAVITISASDGSASVSQGFRVEVNAGPKEATVVITRLLDADRQQISNPSGISGTIYVVLDVESNDETWTDIGLTLGGETVTPMCRGSASADVAVGPGLAAAGQAEIECQLTTNAVVGECVGMQLDPKYANGEYQLGAFLTTDADERRAAIAPLPISLGNHGFVMIAHVPGSQSELGAHTSGLTFYGGPNAEGNVNQFHACPVAYDGTVVGKMRLSTMHTDTSRPTPTPVADATSLSFRESRFGPDYPSKEAPFTWSAGTQWWNPNNSLENIPGGDDASETWIVNDGQILDPNGLDATATFRAGGETAKLGPLHFDFKAPVRTNESEVVIATSNNPATWESTTATYYRDSSGGSTRRLRITEMTEMGVGHVYGTTSAIAVGDCGVAGNADTRGSTAFTPLGGLENVTLINQLPEEDPIANGVADGGGVDCYVAEVQSLADRLGNAVGLADVARIRTASTFGVDRTAPEISRERPSEALVLSSNSLFFEVEDPRLGTGEDGSGLARNVLAWAGSSNPNSGQVYWRASGTTVAANGSVEIDIDPAGNARFAREASHTVYAATPDVAGNYASTAFTFVRDQSDPVLSLSAVPNDFGSITAKSVSVSVAGTLNDATEIRRAFLSIHHGTTCTADDPLEASQVSGPVRRLDNDSNSIEFSEVFTVKQGDDNSETSYCFFLHGEDDARDADDRAAANSYSDVISTFSVTWPAGPVVPPGPTFEFQSADDAAIRRRSALDEGSTAHAITGRLLGPLATADAPTATAPVTVTISPPAEGDA